MPTTRDTGLRTAAEKVEMYDAACRAKTPEEVKRWLSEVTRDRCYEHNEETVQQAEAWARKAICYWAVYFSHEVRLRVEKLYEAEHPVFGPATRGPIDPTQAYLIGRESKAPLCGWPMRPGPSREEP